MPVGHYENFPVASYLLPEALRAPVAVVYRFARHSDDLADEGDVPDAVRIAALAAMGTQLDHLAAGEPPDTQPEHDLFVALARVQRDYHLDFQPFHDLLSAFTQDVTKKSYASFTELLDYCRRSANPVGRIMLGLYGAVSEINLARSDRICSALQLINFWQDVGIDRWMGRIYLPEEDLKRFGVSRGSILQGEVRGPWHALMQFEIDRARSMMLEGAPLALALPGRIGWELRLVVQGGLRILKKIEDVDHDVFKRRPRLNPLDWCLMIWEAFRMRA